MKAPSAGDPSVWRTAGGDNARRGWFPGAVRWHGRASKHCPALGAVQASAIFDAAGTAFVADMAGSVQAFATKGRRRWQIRLQGGVSATPVLDPSDSMLFVATHTGDVVAVEAATGVIRWRRAIPTRKDPRILSDLLLLPRSNRIVLSSWGGRFFALDAATGEPRHDWDAGISPQSAAAADLEENVYTVRAVSGRGTELVRVGVDGQEAVLHREPEDSRGAGRALVAAAPVVDANRGTLYWVVSRERAGQLLAWSLARGALGWRRELAAPVQAALTLLTDGTVIVGDMAGHVHAFDPEGTRRFERALDCDYLLAGGVSAGADGLPFVIGDPVGVVREVDVQGSMKRLFEATRSIQARPSVDPAGHLHVPCTDGWSYRVESSLTAG